MHHIAAPAAALPAAATQAGGPLSALYSSLLYSATDSCACDHACPTQAVQAKASKKKKKQKADDDELLSDAGSDDSDAAGGRRCLGGKGLLLRASAKTPTQRFAWQLHEHCAPAAQSPVANTDVPATTDVPSLPLRPPPAVPRRLPGGRGGGW